MAESDVRSDIQGIHFVLMSLLKRKIFIFKVPEVVGGKCSHKETRMQAGKYFLVINLAKTQ